MTYKIRTTLVIAVVLVQVVFFSGWYAYEADAFDQPVARIKVKTVPYDPRDFLSGQYIQIRYDFSDTYGRWDPELNKRMTPDWAQDLPEFTYDKHMNKEVWVILHEENGLYEPKTASYTKPIELADGEVLIKGRRDSWNIIIYGIEKYFVPEGTEEPDRNNTIVELDIYKSGKSRIHQVFVDGKPWP